jgi:hypothetical protein
LHLEDNALGRRLDPPDSSSSVPLILRGMALILPRAQAIRWPRGRVGGRRVLDGAWSGRVGFGRSSIIQICTTASFENRTQRGSSREKARNPAESLALARLHPIKTPGLSRAVGWIGGSTLEIYLIHYQVLGLRPITSLAFPLNVVAILIVSVVLARLLAAAAGWLRDASRWDGPWNGSPRPQGLANLDGARVAQ